MRALLKTVTFTNSSHRKTRAQSLVEFAIALPVLLLLLLGMVEFGFMLNTYLSLQDAARAAARRYSTVNPFDADGNDDATFYQSAAEYVVETLAPSGDPAARQIPVDSTRDNILISLIEVEVTSSDPISLSLTRHPLGTNYYKLYGDTDPATGYADDRIQELLTENDAVPLNAGLLIIEIYYSYEGVINTPFTTLLMSEDNPVTLYTSAVMPTTYLKPLTTETP